MNIFKLDEDIDNCAKYHNDKHVVKMSTEYAQLLSTCHRVLDGTLWWGHSSTGRKIQRWFLQDGQYNHMLYKASHINHPCNKWLRESAANYQWLYNLWIRLGEEYTHRYGRLHLAHEKLHGLLSIEPHNIPQDVEPTDPPAAMTQYPHCIVTDNIVASYRNYYWEAKKDFSKWTRRPKPDWWHLLEQAEIDGTLGSGLILE